jgi:hypothetical protein
MVQFPVPLNSGESIQRSEEDCVYVKNSALGVGYSLVFGTLWLTNQRIVYRSKFLGSQTIYPLSHLTTAGNTNASVSEKKVSTPFYNRYHTYDSALELNFDNNGTDYFIPQDIDGWSAAILEAKRGAPELAYVQAPPQRPSIGQSNRTVWTIFGIFAAIVLLFICGVGSCIGFTFLLALINASAK